MAKKLSRPIDVLNSVHSEFCWDTFIPSIISGKYVLVLGSEIMLSKTQNVECDGDSTRLIFNSVKEDLINSSHLGPDHPSRNFTELSHCIPDISKCIRAMVKDGLEFSVDEIEPMLISLIRTRLFRVVVTTTIDPYIEMLMREVWGDELKVMDINSDCSSDSFDYDSYCRDDISDMVPPTLYYVFGRAVSQFRFVSTDNDAIEVMAKWMSKEAPHNFLTYIRSKRTLALGCKFDDWFFRFFWYALKGNVKGLSRGEVAISLDDSSETDLKLKTYLSRTNIYFRPDARTFLSQLLNRLGDYKAGETGRIVSSRRTGGVFLSYAHEDINIVMSVYYRFMENGIPVWLDERNLAGGNDYEKEIEKAISYCRFFVPVLSAQVQNDLQTHSYRFYKDKEWIIAQTLINSGRDIKVIPLRVWGYDLRDERNSFALPECMRNKTVHDLEKQSMDELILHLCNIFN